MNIYFKTLQIGHFWNLYTSCKKKNMEGIKNAYFCIW